ncbi:hypothetical protein [Rhodoligotrophos defluvii]|uniref:hypothetical protein n=1 Tax=Rhodoligotrophos defluvii TaxID=2561934 RepID=UPI001484FA69|nr:hypothetical protein [Rhodoligotrophos defluvii]
MVAPTRAEARRILEAAAELAMAAGVEAAEGVLPVTKQASKRVVMVGLVEAVGEDPKERVAV